MQAYNLLRIVLLIVLLAHCSPNPFETEKVSNESKLNEFLYQYFLLVYFPEQSRKASCEKPNAILLDSICITAKVSSGLIYDGTTNQPITTETVSPGQSFRCLCNGQESNSVYWKKAIDTVENPASNPNLITVFVNGDYTHNKITFRLDYKIHYNQPDNLYCIAVCPIDLNVFSDKYQYQFLKIR